MSSRSTHKGNIDAAALNKGPDASRYVRSNAGALIDIHDVNPDDRYAQGPYSCLACNHLMVPALGRIRKHHFKHKAGRPVDCHNETYLHQLAKMILFTSISEAMDKGHPYYLTSMGPAVCSHHEEQHGILCRGQQTPHKTDLARLFDDVRLEVGVNGFVADILLSSSQSEEHMLLEVAVTHACEEAKIKSGLPIVEVSIRSEDDANRLVNGLDARHPHTRCHNIQAPPEVTFVCDTPCHLSALALLLYENGKAWYADLSIGTSDEEYILRNRTVTSHKVIDVRKGRQERPWEQVKGHLQNFIVEQAFVHGQQVRSCLLCWNNGGNVNKSDVYCLAKSSRVWMSSGAVMCNAYDPAVSEEDAYALFSKIPRSC